MIHSNMSNNASNFAFLCHFIVFDIFILEQDVNKNYFSVSISNLSIWYVMLTYDAASEKSFPLRS